MPRYRPTVRATVIDLTADVPQEGDRFLVDTNVWYWLAYTRAQATPRPPSYHQTRYYPAYVKAALTAKSQILWSGLAIAELSSLIERSEWQIFCATARNNISLKEYRHGYSNERQKQVIPEINAAWGVVTSFGNSLDTLIDEPTTTQSVSSLSQQELDGYDGLMMSAALKVGIDQVITDDIDFVTASGITVFTANRNAIDAARSQNRLLKR